MMFYTVEVRDDTNIIGNYRLDSGSLDFHLNKEKRIPFDYVDFNKYQSCYVNISSEEYERNRNLDEKVFHAGSFEAYFVEDGKRDNVSKNITVSVKRAL